MTVVDRIRAVTADEQGGARPELAAAGRGALTAALSWVVVVALTLLGVLGAGAGIGDALGAGSALWLALGGARLGLGATTIALVPLLALAALVLAARTGVRRTLADLADDPYVDGGLRDQMVSPFARRAGAWLGGYAGTAVLAWLVSLAGPFDVRPLSFLLPALVVPLTGLVLAVPPLLEPVVTRGPAALRRGLVPGLRAAGLMLAAGSLLVLVMTVGHLSRVLHVQSELGAGAGGGALLGLLQLLALPNLGLWGTSWLVGSGFSLSLGAETTWAHSQTSLLPMVPVLAAHPEPGDLPWVTRVVVLVPVAVGAWAARDTLARLSRLSRTSTKAGAVACAVLVAALALGLLDAVAGGSLGGDRLADVGAPAGSMVIALLLTLGLGAALVLARDWWRLRR